MIRKLMIAAVLALGIGIGGLAGEGKRKASTSPQRPAEWMEGGWGFRFNMPSIKDPDALDNFDVAGMIDQVKALDTASWVQINITQGANGSFFTSPHADLAEHVSPKIVPQRDLFGEMLDALIAAGFKVHVYFASEGPTMKKHPKKALPGVIDSWLKYAESLGLSPDEAVAEVIVKQYSLRYGRKISGWWFDHAIYGDIPRLAKAARAGNPAAAVSFNVGASPSLRTCPQADFTSGHPEPLKRKPPSWKGNEAAIRLIEKRNYVKGSLGHFFPPMQSAWNSGDPAFETKQVIEWTRRVTAAKGAITWAVALADPRRKAGPLATVQFEQLVAVNDAIRGLRSQASRNQED